MRIVVIFLFIHWFSVAQVLDNRTGEAFTDRPFFNEDFIKAASAFKQLNNLRKIARDNKNP